MIRRRRLMTIETPMIKSFFPEGNQPTYPVYTLIFNVNALLCCNPIPKSIIFLIIFQVINSKRITFVM